MIPERRKAREYIDRRSPISQWMPFSIRRFSINDDGEPDEQGDWWGLYFCIFSWVLFRFKVEEK